MAGPLMNSVGNLYRFGQDGSAGYGRGVIIHRVDRLNPEGYSESVVAPMKLRGREGASPERHGPHTLLSVEGGFWVDFYHERWSPFAGVRRVVARTRR